MSSSKSFGLVVGEYLFIGTPLRSTRNLEKFHFMKLPKVPPNFDVRYLYKGCALPPFTFIFENMSKLTSNCLMYSLISASGLGSFIKFVSFIFRPFLISKISFKICYLSTKLITRKSKNA